MTKLQTIKYLILAAMAYSSVMPGQVIALENDTYKSERPALLALEWIRPMALLAEQPEEQLYEYTLVFGSALIGQTNPNINENKDYPESEMVSVKQNVIVTAYSSTPDQTDSSPFITAMGSHVRDGIVAANFLKFGTKVRLPEIYGDKTFVVEDRMAKRNSHKVDIWMESRELALQFGVKRLTVEILE